MDEQDVKVILREEISEEIPPAEQISAKRPQIMRIICQVIPILLISISVTFFTSTAISMFSGIRIDKIFVTRLALGRIVGSESKVHFVSPPTNTMPNTHPRPNLLFADTEIPENDSLPPPVLPSVEEYNIMFNNETPYSPDVSELLNMPRVIEPLENLIANHGCDAPIVLIIHTHGTEAYSDYSDSSYRTDDKSNNIVAVGKIIADRLNESGISTIHCDTLFDAEDFNMAYYNASLEIRRILQEYPSVTYIIDVHRDSVELSDGTHYPLKAETDGQIAAQLMFVVGTDYGGSGHTDWQENLSLAARIQYNIGTNYPALMRNINLRSASFNQQYTKGSLILEVGSSGNTLEEAKISADIFVKALIREIKGY